MVILSSTGEAGNVKSCPTTGEPEEEVGFQGEKS